MHFVTLKNGSLGAVVENHLVELEAASIALNINLPCKNMWGLLDGSPQLRSDIEAIAMQAYEQHIAYANYASQLVGSPLTYLRRNVFCIGKNYADHAAEIADKMGISAGLSKYPIVFTKATNTLIGPLDTIPLHRGIRQNRLRSRAGCGDRQSRGKHHQGRCVGSHIWF